jgi:hypothetical protein
MAIWKRVTFWGGKTNASPIELHLPWGVCKKLEENNYNFMERHILTRSQMEKLKRHFGGVLDGVNVSL